MSHVYAAYRDNVQLDTFTYVHSKNGSNLFFYGFKLVIVSMESDVLHTYVTEIYTYPKFQAFHIYKVYIGIKST